MGFWFWVVGMVVGGVNGRMSAEGGGRGWTHTHIYIQATFFQANAMHLLVGLQRRVHLPQLLQRHAQIVPRRLVPLVQPEGLVVVVAGRHGVPLVVQRHPQTQRRAAVLLVPRQGLLVAGRRLLQPPLPVLRLAQAGEELLVLFALRCVAWGG